MSLVVFCLVTAVAVNGQTLSDLEQQKTQAVESGNFKLAHELKMKIAELKEREEAEKLRKAQEASKAASSGSDINKEIEILENEKKAAVDKQDFILANELKKKISVLKEKAATAKTTTTETTENFSSDPLAFLEKEKADAVADANYKLAAEINAKIKELKAKAAKPQQSGTVDISTRIKELEEKKAAAVASANYKLAGELNNQIRELKADPTKLQNAKSVENALQAKIKDLEEQKKKAVSEANYKLAGELNAKILDMKVNPSKYEASMGDNNTVDAKIKTLEEQKKKAIADANYKLAGELNAKIIDMKVNPSKYEASMASNSSNDAQIKALEDRKAAAIAAANYKLAGEISIQINNLKNPTTPSVNYSVVNDNTGVRISKSGENEMAGINYRRSSLYSIIRSGPSDQYANAIQQAFISYPVPTKFNNHNLNARVIPPGADLTNEVAKNMVAAWFNRDAQGKFNMELIKERGLYNASSYDINVAEGSSRGLHLLEDAGEELISNTFVIINELKFTSKEEVADKTAKALKTAGFFASFIPGAGSYIKMGTDAAALGTKIAGKGYWIKNTSHLYQLVWNQEIANEFYTKYWIDENNFDPYKKAAFDNCNLFTLRYIGEEAANADLQSSIFTNKTEEQLAAKATLKAVDAGIAKLERKFEQFRTKTPLYSADPLTAKIGTKEGLQANDKFEVLEQVQDENGKMRYVRKGIIYVDGKNIWDNTYSAEELQAMGKDPNSQNQYTVFRGGSGFAPGMLIRQIN